MLLRGTAAGLDEPPRLRLAPMEAVAWVSGRHKAGLLRPHLCFGLLSAHIAARFTSASSVNLPPFPPFPTRHPQVNDLEKGAKYARWPRKLQSLLMPSFGGAAAARALV